MHKIYKKSNLSNISYKIQVLFLVLYITTIIFTITTVFIKGKNTKQNNNLILYNLTDTNWDKGISRNENIFLFSNTSYNYKLLKKANKIKSKDIIVTIESINNDKDWIRVKLSDIKINKQYFINPNILEIIK